jgi:hypothetical protein
VFEPEAAIYEAAAEVSEQLGLPPGWLNDAVKGFLAGDDPEAAPVLEVPGPRCLAASARMLLALKVLAHRVGEDEANPRASVCEPAEVCAIRPAVGGADCHLTAGFRRERLREDNARQSALFDHNHGELRGYPGATCRALP